MVIAPRDFWTYAHDTIDSYPKIIEEELLPKTFYHDKFRQRDTSGFWIPKNHDQLKKIYRKKILRCNRKGIGLRLKTV